MTKRLQSDLKLPPHIPIFLELDEHLRQGKMSLKDMGVYQLLNRWCNWRTGIYYGCAATIAALMGGRAKTAEVQRSLGNLRKYRFINYPFGKGSRGSYNILIDGFLPRVGERRGYRLNAFAPNSLDQPQYERANGRGTLDGLSRNGAQSVGEPPQEEQEYKGKRRVESKNKKVGRSVGRRAQPSAADSIAPHLSLYSRGTGKESVPNDGENSDHFEPEGHAEAAADPDTKSILPAESDPAARLASRLFEFQGGPAKFRAELPAWAGRFRKLLQIYGDDFPEVMEYAFTQDDFWPQKLIRDDDPLGYLEQKLAEGTILKKFRTWKTATINRRGIVQPQVASNGQKHSRACKGITGKQPVDNDDAAEEALRRFAERLGIDGESQSNRTQS